MVGLPIVNNISIEERLSMRKKKSMNWSRKIK
jgi:hypothetical protein